jgi:O-acetyl-ADP-ribose deacetylase (regulator of RNase III)
MIEIIDEDLLEAKEQYIAHACNCVSNNSAGIAKSIFDKFPYANTYINRIEKDQPGTIKILGNNNQRFIINMFCQIYPGAPKYPTFGLDGIISREKYFHKCLMEIAKIFNLKSIAFPYGICCGLAKGNWDHYLGTLNNFEKYVNEKFETKVTLYKLK